MPFNSYVPIIPFKICFYSSIKKPLFHKNMQNIPYNIEYSFAIVCIISRDTGI